MTERVATSQWRRMCDHYRDEQDKLRVNIIYGESHFNIIKMHLLSHFCDQIHQQKLLYAS